MNITLDRDTGSVLVNSRKGIIKGFINQVAECQMDDGDILFVVQDGEFSACGMSPDAAENRLRKIKFFMTPEEQRIQNFVTKYKPDDVKTADEWVEIFQELTGACTRGAATFVRVSGKKRYDKFTTLQFLEIVSNVYNAQLIDKVKEHYNQSN